ncbi:MAG: porphobilinogen synthase [SAR324 cluster bacterium]|nr:porphobilinogen synthase [SAR324 cluster bacterium]MCZ6646241.1 porphobilinogen synthase [SAR324 cluster bacterium]
MTFPATRPRRLRASPGIRRMVRETRLGVDDLLYPMFIADGTGVRNEVPSMPEVFQLSIDEALKEIEEVVELGIPAINLFGVPDHKDLEGKYALDDNGLIQQAVRAIKDKFPDLVVMTDVCFCEWLEHGHCGVVRGESIVNDETLEKLSQMAISHAKAGADIVSPSDMMDGRIQAIRGALDGAGLSEVPIMAYSAKMASAFYGPFRDAAQGAPQFGDRTTYQMDYANGREAIKEALLDIAEAADFVMVKPALAYLDIIWRVRQETHLPVAAYNVSGEYAMLWAAERAGWLELDKTMLETLTAIKRAGADIILTYFAKRAARLLQGN